MHEGGALRLQPERAHRPSDVLEALFARIHEREIELAGKLLVRRGGDQYAPWWAELLQAGCDVHAVPQQIVALDHHVAEMDANPQGDAALAHLE